MRKELEYLIDYYREKRTEAGNERNRDRFLACSQIVSDLVIVHKKYFGDYPCPEQHSRFQFIRWMDELTSSQGR
jgi:hypothetical protein